MSTAIKCPTNRPTLQLGASSQFVKEMQKALNQRLAELDTLSDYPLQVLVTSHFEEQTQDAVKYFQCLAFLKTDGIVGKNTWAYLCEGANSLPELSQGSSGSLVKAVQHALKNGKYYSGEVDGIFGAKTTEAIQAFQASRYQQPNGIIGYRTWNALSRFDAHISHCIIDTFD
ncbi:MAG: peptidoglycan-binding protein [Tolypothrix carrinoi HA7290-LM1]|jgi:peptidoglycan L-alanyl-D-glutamate endopeptidase CwlK|nr:peptidoglycan-binding protein [Tolypothrix carrinoi HA7290-LM1]